jgi:hypothetical protein
MVAKALQHERYATTMHGIFYRSSAYQLDFLIVVLNLAPRLNAPVLQCYLRGENLPIPPYDIEPWSYYEILILWRLTDT